MTATWIKPLPVITPASRPFFDGLREHVFRVPRCQSCGHYNWSPYPACRSCLSIDQEWVEVSGRGSLYTFSEIHVGPLAFTQDGPYIWAFAKLAEGPRPLIVMGNLTGVEPGEVEVDMPIKIGYHDVPGHDLALYHFERDTDAR
jgi:uncharacterized OB-fold protein